MMLPLVGRERNILSHRQAADMRDDDEASMLFWLAESVVNIAHIGKVK